MTIERRDLSPGRNFVWAFLALLLCLSLFGRRPPLGFAMTIGQASCGALYRESYLWPQWRFCAFSTPALGGGKEIGLEASLSWMESTFGADRAEISCGAFTTVVRSPLST
jgi:hypothetical protein